MNTYPIDPDKETTAKSYITVGLWMIKSANKNIYPVKIPNNNPRSILYLLVIYIRLKEEG